MQTHIAPHMKPTIVLELINTNPNIKTRSICNANFCDVLLNYSSEKKFCIKNSGKSKNEKKKKKKIMKKTTHGHPWAIL